MATRARRARFEASRVCLLAASVALALGGAGLLLAQTLGLTATGRALAQLLGLGGALGALGAGSARSALGAPRADRLFQVLLLAAGSCALVLPAAEWATRAALSQVTTTGNLQSWFSKRWMAGLSLSRAGFRERDVEAASPGVFRIAVIGDSLTFAMGLPVEERYTERLEHALNASGGRGARYQVLNFGVPGVDTDEEIRIARRFALPAEPDFLLLQWYVNDPMLGARAGLPQPLGLMPWQSLTALLRGHSALFVVTEIGWSRLQQALGWTPSFADYMRDRFGAPDSPDARAADGALRGFLALAEEHGVPAGLVLFPSLDGTRELAFLHERVLSFCEGQGLVCLDLQGHFAALGEARSLWVNRFDAHPGPRAHRAAAEAIVERFGPLWGVD